MEEVELGWTVCQISQNHAETVPEQKFDSDYGLHRVTIACVSLVGEKDTACQKA